MNRAATLARLDQNKQWDIVIIGGGATGLGSALDAASRGYETLLVEQYDFGKGTSSRSTKLVHGGVRYLAQGNLKLVMEALRERSYLLKNAPHLTTTLPFVVPVFRWRDKFYYAAGLKLYDLMSGKRSLGKTSILNKKETLQHLPGIRGQGLKGGILYYDGQFDDSKLAIDLALTAAKFGGAILNYCRVTALQKTKNKLSTLTIEDTLQKRTYEIKTRSVINATGVFTDSILCMDEPEEDNLVMPSQGIHLVVDRKFFPGSNALMIPRTEDGRVLFAVPWHDKVVIGTTDTPINIISIEPHALEEEIEFILLHTNKYFQTVISRKDITSVYAGLRPLVKQRGAKNTSLLSRDHTILVSKSGLVTITGGKWTTYRKMAEDAVDNAVFVSKLPKRECRTKNLPIGEPGRNPGNILGESFHLSREDIRRFVEKEMAVNVEDILARRTRLLFLDAKSAVSMAPFVAREMAAILDKSPDWEAEQLDLFTQLAEPYSVH